MAIINHSYFYISNEALRYFHAKSPNYCCALYDFVDGFVSNQRFICQLIAALDPLTVTILRLCFAAVIVAVMFRSWKIWSRLPYLKWRDLLMYCASLGLMNILFYTSLGKLPQGIAVGLEFIGPLGLALVSIKQRAIISG